MKYVIICVVSAVVVTAAFQNCKQMKPGDGVTATQVPDGATETVIDLSDKKILQVNFLIQEKQTITRSSGSYESIENKKEEIKDLHKQIKKIQSSKIDLDEIIRHSSEFTVNGETSKLVFADLDLNDREVLAGLADQIKNKIQKGIIVIIGKDEATHPVIISVTKDLNTKFKAGDLLKEFAQVLGGKGGGRPDFAQGAVPDRTQLKKAFELIKSKVTMPT